jgi:hypothetical protein
LDFDKLGHAYSEKGNRELVFETFKTHLIFPTERMNAAAYQERLGLNEKEAQAAATMQAKQQFLLRKGDEPAVVLNLHVDERTRLMLSTQPHEHRARMELAERYGLSHALDLLVEQTKRNEKALAQSA